MKLPMEWLSEFVDIGATDIKAYCDRMTDTGSKVEGWEALAEDIVNVVVGRIESVTRHPDADKLQICMIDVGDPEPLQIVTGAQNVFAGAMVPVAKAPATLPGGVHIKTGKLRGVPSYGMLCSIAELGLTLNDMPDAVEDGILILNVPCKPGDDVCDVLSLRDKVVEFEITPNRPDCLSVIGLARETAVSFDKKAAFHTPVVSEGTGSINDYLSVKIEDKELCKRYTARVVKNVKIAPSPLWMRMRLRAAGVRPINNIVDITNYVMLEYGQPMHAFDYACLDGSRIVVRDAKDCENFKSLDDADHVLKSSMLVIADDKKAVALAGIMGGANSEIKDSTETVVFESANFLGSSVRLTSRALGMRTESSGRFEKGLDEENTLPAVQRACELVELLGAGEVVSGIIDERGQIREQTRVPLEVERINHFLGVDISESYMRRILTDLEFTFDGDTILVPSFRQDVACMNDIAEEIIRIYGYNTIESTLFRAGVRVGSRTDKQNYRQHLNDHLCSLGFYEAYTFSFISPRYYDKIGMKADDPLRRSMVISNPLGEDTSIMRTTILPSLLEVLGRNNNYHSHSAALYETAAIYLPQGENELPREPLQTVLGFYGEGDFFTLKGTMESVLADAGVRGRYTACRDNPSFHPGRCAAVSAPDGTFLAVMGQIHPEVAKNYGFDDTQAVYAAVIDFEALFEHRSAKKEYTPLPKYPAVTRDFSFVCDRDLEAGAIEETMFGAGGKLLVDVTLFDLYEGAQVPAGKKSLSFTLSFRAPDRTLTDTEVNAAQEKILAALEAAYGITLRA